MADKHDIKQEDPKYPTFRESMREITSIVGKNPMISTESKKIIDEKGKRVFRKFKDAKGILSETDQTKSGKTVLIDRK
jgi:hypothetical protein